MKELEIQVNEAGQRLDKYLKKYLKNAPDSFIYKMLRKKNIVLNKKKADGSERLAEGDEIKFFLSEETIEKFKGAVSFSSSGGRECLEPEIVYEDSQVIFFNVSESEADRCLHGGICGLIYVEKRTDQGGRAAGLPAVCVQSSGSEYQRYYCSGKDTGRSSGAVRAFSKPYA